MWWKVYIVRVCEEEISSSEHSVQVTTVSFMVFKKQNNVMNKNVLYRLQGEVQRLHGGKCGLVLGHRFSEHFNNFLSLFFPGRRTFR